MTTLRIANEYGNIETPPPSGYTHVPGKRLQPLCRKLNIRYAPAMVGWAGTRRHPKPLFDGVVVATKSAPKLLAEIECRSKRNTPEKRAAAQKSREKRQQAERRRLLAMGVNPDSRTAKWLKSGDIDQYQAQLIAFRCRLRHEHSNYNAVLSGCRDKDFARQEREEDEIPDNWDEYLRKYDFPYPEVAQQLASILRSPTNAHPVWFCKAILAVVRSEVTPRCYHDIRDAIRSWDEWLEMMDD